MIVTAMHFKASSSPGQGPLAVEDLGAVTIFVGPNNAGKSQALREVFAYCRDGQVNAPRQIVEKLEFEGFSKDAAEARFQTVRTSANPNEFTQPGQSFIFAGGNRLQVDSNHFLRALQMPNQNLPQFAGWYLRSLVISLDGAGRMSLANGQQRGDLKDPRTPFAKLLTKNSKRAEWRKIIFDAVVALARGSIPAIG